MIVHALLLAFVIAPTVHSDFRGAAPALGAGGPGLAGGGGGGAPGERLQFVAVRPAAPPPLAPPAQPDVARVAPPVTTSTVVSPPSTATAPAAATGTGTGGAGAGPGTGGGTSSGIGTGTGSSVGPGTGGGTADQYPPTPTQFFLPPLPAPERIKPYHLIAWFDVDERGNAKLLGFNPSRDNGYNRRLRDVLMQLRFRPAVRADGTPVRDTVDIHYIF